MRAEESSGREEGEDQEEDNGNDRVFGRGVDEAAMGEDEAE